MKVAMITRGTLFKVPGGDTVQVTETAKNLLALGVQVEIKLTDEMINYNLYDLFHFFNITRPADLLYHIKRTKKPFVVSTILVDYSEYDKHYRKGISGLLLKYFDNGTNEYIKTLARVVLRKDKLVSWSFILKGQQRSIISILKECALVLPNSYNEYERLKQCYDCHVSSHVVYNGINKNLFSLRYAIQKDDALVICVARIEGIKNQLNLIKALNNTRFKLLLIGSPAPNQSSYYYDCKKHAASNITFINHLPQEELLKYYQQAKVHVLPSWFETTGLSSLEAAAIGCNVVITNRGDAKEYFADDAFYCDPASPSSIYYAIEKASQAPTNKTLQERIISSYTWSEASKQTLNAYNKVLKV
jgi:glycosyltransferase involved in cell wall biosynthesis